MLKFNQKLFSTFKQFNQKVENLIQQFDKPKKQVEILIDLLRNEGMVQKNVNISLNLARLTQNPQIQRFLFTSDQFKEFVNKDSNKLIQMPYLTGVQILQLYFLNNQNQNSEVQKNIEEKVLLELSDDKRINELVHIHNDSIPVLYSLRKNDPKLNDQVKEILSKFFDRQKDMSFYVNFQFLNYFYQENQNCERVEKIKQKFIKSVNNFRDITSLMEFAKLLKLNDHEKNQVQKKIQELLENEFQVYSFCKSICECYFFLTENQRQIYIAQFDRTFPFLEDEQKIEIVLLMSDFQQKEIGENFKNYLQNLESLSLPFYSQKLVLLSLIEKSKIETKLKQNLLNELTDLAQIKKLDPLEIQNVLQSIIKLQLCDQTKQKILSGIRTHLESRPFQQLIKYKYIQIFNYEFHKFQILYRS